MKKLLFILFFIPLFSLAQSKWYVATTGNDGNAGTIGSPYLTLDKALVSYKADTNPLDTIFIRGGSYAYTSTSFSISEVTADSARALVFTSYNGEHVVITGGQTLSDTAFHLITGADPAYSRLTASAQTHVYLIDLNVAGITNYGLMQDWGTAFPLNRPSNLELFYNHTPYTLARWPNYQTPKDSALTIGTVLTQTSFNYSGFTRPNTWAASNDKWILGTFASGYTNDNIRVDSINTSSSTIYLRQAPGNGLFSTANAQAGGNIRSFYFYNILEELDQPGEYFLDSTNKKLYLWPTDSTNIANATVEVSMLDAGPIVNISNGAHITFYGITFSTTRQDAIVTTNSDSITLRRDTIINIGLTGLVANTNCNNHHIDSCYFAHLGGGGPVLNGGNRKTLTNSGNWVKNSEFTDFSRHYKTYSPAVYSQGVGDTIQTNYIHDNKSQAILYSGNNAFMGFNQIKNVCTWYSDMGAVYTGRDPSATGNRIINNFFINIQNLNSSPAGTISAVYIDDGSGGMTVDSNYFYLCGSGGHGAVHLNGGGYTTFLDNHFIACLQSLSNSVWTEAQWNNFWVYPQPGNDSIFLNKILKTVDIRTSVYTTQYPWLVNFFADTTHATNPRNNNLTNTIFYSCTQPVISAASSYVVVDSIMVNANPGYANPIKLNFRQNTAPPGVGGWSPAIAYPDFTKIPMYNPIWTGGALVLRGRWQTKQLK